MPRRALARRAWSFEGQRGDGAVGHQRAERQCALQLLVDVREQPHRSQGIGAQVLEEAIVGRDLAPGKVAAHQLKQRRTKQLDVGAYIGRQLDCLGLGQWQRFDVNLSRRT